MYHPTCSFLPPTSLNPHHILVNTLNRDLSCLHPEFTFCRMEKVVSSMSYYVNVRKAIQVMHRMHEHHEIAFQKRKKKFTTKKIYFQMKFSWEFSFVAFYFSFFTRKFMQNEFHSVECIFSPLFRYISVKIAIKMHITLSLSSSTHTMHALNPAF